MILFNAKRDGTVTTTPDLVPQGSSMQDLVVVSEFDYAYCAIKLLPASGEYIEDIPCTPILQRDFSTIFTAALPPKATVVAGSVDYQLVFTAADGTTQTTLVGSFTVPRGVPVSTPPTVGDLSVKTVGDLYAIMDNTYGLFVGHERNIYQNTANIAALKKTIASAGYVTIPVSEWNDGNPTIATFTLDGFGAGMTALLTPVNPATQTAAREARLSAYPEVFVIDGDTQTVEIIRANADKAPEIPLRFAYLILKTEATTVPTVAILGVDAYGEGGGTASGVDETAVKKIINSLLGNVDNVRQYSADNPPPYPVTSVNGKTGAVSLSIPSKAADVGADPAGTASSKLTTHNVDTASHQDLRLELQRLADRLNAALNSTDTSLDDLKEIVAYIKSNKTLIDGITSSKVNVTDIVNNLTTNTANVPLSAAQGVALKLLIDSLEEIVEGKVTAEQVSADIANALKGYQPAGDYLTPTAAAPIINTEVDKVVTERKEELRGKDGKTPEAGVDYPTVEQVDSYIAAELAKRNQFVPIPAASVEDMTDTTKIYYLTATGELYAYAPTQVVVGGYTNLADPTSSDWKTRSRLNASAVIASASAEADRSFVSNQIPATNGQTVRIKGVTATTNTAGTATNFTAVLYDSSGTQLNTKPFLLKQPVSGSGFSTDTSHQSWNAVHVTADGVYEWVLGLNNGGGVPHPSVASFRVSGLAVTSAEDIIITVGQEIKDPEIVTEYAWAGTGHFISSEEAITALESRVNVLEDEVEELTVTVDRLKTNSSISMQSGAVWYALGDSITQGYASRVNTSATNGYDQYVAAEGKRWVDYVASLNGYKLTNKGVGGTGYQHATNNARAQVDAVDFSECDLVTLAYGINDFKNAGTNIGSMDDDIQAGGSFVSNMRYCIKKILSDNPLCKIIVITPLNYRGLGNYATNYSIGYTGSNASCANLDYMVDLMEQVCKYHGIEMIDMTHESIVNRENIVSMLPDYVHPSEECHRVMGYELARKINFA